MGITQLPDELREEMAVAADEGIADIEAGLFEVISGPEDMERLQGELTAKLDQIAGQHRSARG